MNPLYPLPLPKIHIIGIGGIGMSGIAELLRHQGYRVQGSDVTDSSNVQRLRASGIDVFIGHDQTHVTSDLSVIVHSTAVKNTNPEVLRARELGIPVISRATMLAELVRSYWTIAISGTHGKTTTTSLVGKVLEALDPTVINGGIVNAYGTNIKIGGSRWMVLEADESDGTFVEISPSIAVVTNIDPEHLDYYKTFDSLKAYFSRFIHSVPFYGFAVVCVDHPVVADLIQQEPSHRLVTYGFEEGADVQGVNLRATQEGTTFDVRFGGLLAQEPLEDCFLPMMGTHNVQNVLTAIAIARKMGIGGDEIKERLAAFQGVKRRFTPTGFFRGMRVIDDYAHHPQEIASALRAARQATSGRIWAIVQPHRYSRLESLWGDFTRCCHGADEVVVTPVFSAGEDERPRFTHDNLAAAMRTEGIPALTATALDEIKGLLESKGRPGDMVVFLGAGTITKWAHELPLDE